MDACHAQTAIRGSAVRKNVTAAVPAYLRSESPLKATNTIRAIAINPIPVMSFCVLLPLNSAS